MTATSSWCTPRPRQPTWTRPNILDNFKEGEGDEKAEVVVSFPIKQLVNKIDKLAFFVLEVQLEFQ